LPAIEVPHPGTSYNPSYEDHQDLLLEAHAIELDKLKREERRIRNLDSKIKKMTAEEIEKLWILEMSGDLLKSDAESDEDGDEKEVSVGLKKDEEKSEKKLSKKQKTRVQKQRLTLIEKLRVCFGF
jgi:nucleolar protein 53